MDQRNPDMGLLCSPHDHRVKKSPRLSLILFHFKLALAPHYEAKSYKSRTSSSSFCFPCSSCASISTKVIILEPHRSRLENFTARLQIAMARSITDDELKRVEDAVAAANASIVELTEELRQSLAKTSLWENPLPDCARLLTEASAELRSLCDTQAEISQGLRVAREGFEENLKRVESRDEKLNEREREQDARHKQKLADKKQKLEAREQKLDGKEQKLETKEQELASQERDLTTQANDQNLRQAQIEEREAHLARRASEIDDDRKELKQEVKAHYVEVGRWHAASVPETVEEDRAATVRDAEAASEQQASAQRQAVDAFLAYLQRGSSVSAPSPQDMIPVHQIDLEPSTVASITSLPALPAIVVAEGHLPAAWSYLSFASRGVLLDNRFNGAITPSDDLPWVIDTLKRVIQAVLVSEFVPASVLIVLLQGIAYVHRARHVVSPTITWNAEPRQLLEALSKSPQVTGRPQSVVGMVYQQVYNMVNKGLPIVFWVSSGAFEEQISSSNSALPEGVVLIHQDTPGTVFLVRSTGNGELFIFDKRSMKFHFGKMYHVTMLLPSIDGLPDDLRQMELADDKKHVKIAKWAFSMKLE